jgi:hypothetical protein
MNRRLAAFVAIFGLMSIVNLLFWKLVTPENELVRRAILIVTSVIAGIFTGIFYILIF